VDAETFVMAALQVAERATDPEHREAALDHLAAQVEGEGGGEGAKEDAGEEEPSPAS
jgi:hypothetical protein